jgi:predicted ribosome quality control (RQC) complex YloA/Tae2 family protein
MVKFDNTFENNPIKIGQNAIDNDNIITEASQTDIWFHLKNFPSCHVIIECSKEFPIDSIMIMHCANLVKQNTKYKNVPNLKVNYIPIKHIQKTNTPGLVIITGKTKNIVC